MQQIRSRGTEVESWARVASSTRGYTGRFVTDPRWPVVATDWPELVGQRAHFEDLS